LRFPRHPQHRGGGRGDPYRKEDFSWLRFQQSTDRLPAIPTSAADLISEFTFRPRRFTAGIPLGEEAQRISIRHREAPYEATTHTEGVQVAMLSGDRRRKSR